MGEGWSKDLERWLEPFVVALGHNTNIRLGVGCARPMSPG